MIQIVSLFVIAVLTAADQLIKYFVVADLKPIGEKTVIPGVLRFAYVENDGAMMGLFGGKAQVMMWLTVVIIAVILVLLMLKKVKFGFNYCCLVAIVAGGIGNLIDRFRLGFVIDYIDVLFVKFYVFNFADCLVTVGAFLMIGYQIYEIIRETREKKQSKENKESENNKEKQNG